VSVLLLACETKVTLGNDLSFLEFLVKTNLDEEEGDVDNHQFYTCF